MDQHVNLVSVHTMFVVIVDLDGLWIGAGIIPYGWQELHLAKANTVRGKILEG